MFSYSHYKTTATKLKKRLEQRILQMNAPISIRDIIVRHKNAAWRYGETQKFSSPYNKQPSNIRLFEHIALLAKTANLYHQKYYCEEKAGAYVIKKDCLNKITRLSLSEFSLYEARPMTMEKFSHLYEIIEALASEQLPNVHLLLSSFAVLTEHKDVLNVALYVECGPEAKIHVLCKSTAAKMDVSYESLLRYEVREANKEIAKGLLSTERGKLFFKNSPGMEFINTDRFNIRNISHEPIFIVKTAGGAEFIQAIDICYDHLFKHAHNVLVNTLSATNSQQVLPSQVEHIVTACSIYIEDASSVAEQVIHVDPVESHEGDLNDLVKECDILNAIDSSYSKLGIHRRAGGFLVANPPFGASIYLTPKEERAVKTIASSLKEKFEQYNQRAASNFLKTQMAFTSQGTKFNLQELLLSLLEKCELTFLESTFNLIGTRQKKAIEQHLTDYFAKQEISTGNQIDVQEELLKEIAKLSSEEPTQFLIDVITEMNLTCAANHEREKLTRT